MTLRQTADLIAYLSGLTVSQGRLAGQAFAVLPWQRRFVCGAFAPGIQAAALSIGRGNGKTTLLAGIAAATLDGPLAVPRGETVIVASSFEQARIGFEHVLAFMGEKLDDHARWKVWDTAQQARIEDRQTGARVRCIGSDPRRAHGLAPVLVLADEPSQWPETTGEAMLAALRTASGKQPHSRFVALGTRPADAEHWFAKMLTGGADYAQRHAAKAGDPPFQERTWRKANPSLTLMPDLLAAIRNEAIRARAAPALLAGFEALRLNLGTSDTEVSTLLSAGLWAEIEGEAGPDGPVVWGVDLGTSAAVRLQLHALAYNLGNFMRTLALPDAVEQWSLTSLREKLIKIGAKIVRHGRYVTFQMAEVVIPRDLFADILRRIDRLRPPPAPA